MPESGMYRALTPDERSRLEQQLAVAVELASGAARNAERERSVVFLLIWARYARVAGEHAYTLAHPKAAKPCRNVDVRGRAWKIVRRVLDRLAPTCTDWDTFAMFAGIPDAAVEGWRPDLDAVCASVEAAALAARSDPFDVAIARLKGDPAAAKAAGDVLEAMAEADERSAPQAGHERVLEVVLWEGAEHSQRNIRLARTRTAFLEARGNVALARQALERSGHKIAQSTFYEHLAVLDKEDPGWCKRDQTVRPDSG